MSERRYNEQEVRRILELATRQEAAPPSRVADGLTLPELQSIAAEAGVDPAAVASAASTLDSGALRAPRRSLGMPIEVGHVVTLPRAPTDDEWDRIVTELRTIFRASGRLSAYGTLREWRNGNLFASIEPAAGGYRLRMGSLKGDAAGVNALGATGLLAAGGVAASMIAAGEPTAALVVPAFLGGAGTGAFLWNLLRLPRWSDRRLRQMKHIGARAMQIVQPAPQLPTAESPGPD